MPWAYSMDSFRSEPAPLVMFARNLLTTSGAAPCSALAIASVFSSRTIVCMSRSGNVTTSSKVRMNLRTRW